MTLNNSFEIIDYPLDSRGLDFIRQVLIDWGTDIGKWLDEGLSWSDGRVCAFIPKEAGEERAHQFKLSIAGQLWNGEKFISKPIYYPSRLIILSNIQNTKSQSVLLVDHNNNIKNPRAYESPLTPLIICHNSVFALADIKTLSKGNIVNILQSASSWNSWGICIDESFEELLKTPETMFSSLDNIKMIFVEAYDGESYVYWKRTEN